VELLVDNSLGLNVRAIAFSLFIFRKEKNMKKELKEGVKYV